MQICSVTVWWGNLPENVVNALSVNIFMSRLNKHWHLHPTKYSTSTSYSQQSIAEYYWEATVLRPVTNLANHLEELGTPYLSIITSLMAYYNVNMVSYVEVYYT